MNVKSKICIGRQPSPMIQWMQKTKFASPMIQWRQKTKFDWPTALSYDSMNVKSRICIGQQSSPMIQWMWKVKFLLANSYLPWFNECKKTKSNWPTALSYYSMNVKSRILICQQASPMIQWMWKVKFWQTIF
jgi:hypothetical protein